MIWASKQVAMNVNQLTIIYQKTLNNLFTEVWVYSINIIFCFSKKRTTLSLLQEEKENLGTEDAQVHVCL